MTTNDRAVETAMTDAEVEAVAKALNSAAQELRRPQPWYLLLEADNSPPPTKPVGKVRCVKALRAKGR